MIGLAAKAVPNYYADLVITAANVTIAKGSPSFIEAGATIARGDVLYKASDGQAELADASAASTANMIGIALSDAAVGQYVTYLANGSLNLGAILTKGQIYVVSATAGKIAPIGDLLSTEILTLIGYAATTSKLVYLRNNTGVVMP